MRVALRRVAAALNERRTDREHMPLLPGEALQPIGRQPPARFGIAAPSAGAGAGRIDQHEVGAAGEVGDRIALAAGRADLDVARAGALQPVEDRPQAMPVGVKCMNLAAIAHLGGERH